MDDNELVDRLRRLGTAPVPMDVAAHHRTLMYTSPPSVGRSPRRFVAVAAATALVIGGGVAVATMSTRAGEPKLDPAPSQAPASATSASPSTSPGDPFPDDSCKGPPPFAGQTPEGDTEAERAANRAAESAAWEERTADCPADDEGPDARPKRRDGADGTDRRRAVGVDEVPVDPFPGDPCKGPPPFAGQRPEGDTEEEREANRAAESAAWEERKSQRCPPEQADPPPPDSPGPPETTPGPPDDTPGR